MSANVTWSPCCNSYLASGSRNIYKHYQLSNTCVKEHFNSPWIVTENLHDMLGTTVMPPGTSFHLTTPKCTRETQWEKMKEAIQGSTLAMCPLARMHFLGRRASSGHNNSFYAGPRGQWLSDRWQTHVPVFFC